MGRKKKSGPRYACGKLKPASKPIAPAAWKRIQDLAERGAVDRALGSELGRLSFFEDITRTEATTGFRIAKVYGRYERLHGLRRSARSPSYDEARSTAIAPEEEAEVETAFDALRTAIPFAHRAAIEQLCVEDKPINATFLPEIRATLERIAHEHFGVANTTKDHDDGAPAPKRRKAKERKAEVSAEQYAFTKTLRKLCPEMDDIRLRKAFHFCTAIKDREIVRREREADSPLPRVEEYRKSEIPAGSIRSTILTVPPATADAITENEPA